MKILTATSVTSEWPASFFISLDFVKRYSANFLRRFFVYIIVNHSNSPNVVETVESVTNLAESPGRGISGCSWCVSHTLSGNRAKKYPALLEQLK